MNLADGDVIAKAKCESLAVSFCSSNSSAYEGVTPGIYFSYGRHVTEVIFCSVDVDHVPRILKSFLDVFASVFSTFPHCVPMPCSFNSQAPQRVEQACCCKKCNMLSRKLVLLDYTKTTFL